MTKNSANNPYFVIYTFEQDVFWRHEDPRFRKTLVLVKNTDQYSITRLNIIEHLFGLILLTYANSTNYLGFKFFVIPA